MEILSKVNTLKGKILNQPKVYIKNRGSDLGDIGWLRSNNNRDRIVSDGDRQKEYFDGFLVRSVRMNRDGGEQTFLIQGESSEGGGPAEEDSIPFSTGV